jgi:hypothetical protein
VQIPDFSTPLTRMADSLSKMAGMKRSPRPVEPLTQVWPQLDQAQPTARESKDLSHA